MAHAKPSWLKVKLPGGERYAGIKQRARSLQLHTVCEEARCPNIGECWSGGTATFMVMGNICTRGCRFCAVNTSRNGLPLDPNEPTNIAHAIAEMELDYVVITSVDRDDLADHGSSHFAQCIDSIRDQTPETLIEVLIPDFAGSSAHLQTVVSARPDVLAHNQECVESLTSKVRDPRASYQTSLDLLATVKEMDPGMPTKSSLMVGVGESEAEMVTAMRDLRAVGCDFLTIGQYLQPTKNHLAVSEYIDPSQFKRYEEIGLELGFGYVASGPLVRSSYRAGEFFIRRHIQERMEVSS